MMTCCHLLSARLADVGICVARWSALPHHMWYKADVCQIVAAELQAQDVEDVEGLILLATSLQVRFCLGFERGLRRDL